MSAMTDLSTTSADERTVDEAAHRLSTGTEDSRSQHYCALDLIGTRSVDAADHHAGSPLLAPAYDPLAVSRNEMGRGLELMRERLAYETEQNNRRQEALEARLLEMQAVFARALADLPRIEEQLNDRLDRLAERAARPRDGEDRRLQVIEGTVGDIGRRVTELTETQGAELEHRLQDRLTTVSAVATAATSRLEILEEHATQVGQEMSQLGDVQAVLDGGLGDLRSTLVELTDVTERLALRQATFDTQLQSLAKLQAVVTVDRRPMLRRAEGPAETGAEVTVDRAPIVGQGGLEDKQMKAHLALLEHMTDTALTASSDASGLEEHVRALAEQLAAHDETLTRLGRSVAQLRRRASS